jgi:selenocysteine lyase/cysteine desulfurase
MSKKIQNLSRRRFLGGAALAAGGLSTGLFDSNLNAQSTAPTVAGSLDTLRPSGVPDEAFWWNVRSQFNVVDRLTFMNNGTLGPVPHIVREAQARVEREIAEDPTNGYRFPEVEQVRVEVASFIGASPDEIAVTRSTTEGMALFANGLKWKEGDEVLMCSHEHFGGKGPYWALVDKCGIKVNVIEIPSPPSSVDEIVGLYERAITPRTRVLMVSHITYVAGLVLPVKELSEMAHRHGVLISVDGAHPLGMLPLDMHALGCDHYAAAGQKWLLAGTGTGVCYVKKDVQDRVHPFVGASPEDRADPEIGELVKIALASARKYELFGQRHVPSAMGMSQAMQLQDAIGKANIEVRVRALSTRFRDGLRDIPGVKLWTSSDPTLSAALTLFSIGDIPMANIVKAILDRDRIYIRTMSTGHLNAVRASTHLYNMPGEVDRLLASVRHVAEHAADYSAT